MSWSPTLFSGSGHVGLPPVPWTEKTIEREVGRAKDLSARLFISVLQNNRQVIWIFFGMGQFWWLIYMRVYVTDCVFEFSSSSPVLA
jgi:hypothetical protein